MATKKGIAQADQRGIEVPGIVLREDPKVYLAAIVGPWLLSHSIPSWRSEDPETGFQRRRSREQCSIRGERSRTR
jgi:hypothetical protein